MRHVSRRRMLIAMAGLAASGLAAACGATPTAAPAATQAPAAATEAPVAAAETKAAAPAGTVKVVYWGHDFMPRVTLDQKYIEQFQKEHENIQVEYVWSGDYDTKLRTALAAATGPDLFAQWNGEIGQFYMSGALVPIETTAFGIGSQQELMDEYDTPDKILAGALFEGKLYGIPNEVSTYGCFMNVKLWKEAGLDPEKDYTGYWDDFPELMEKLTKRDASGNITQFGWDFWWDDAFGYIVNMSEQLGVFPIDQDKYTANLEAEEVVSVMQFLADWVNKYKLGGPAYHYSQETFLTGTVATDGTNGSWGIPGMKDAHIDFVLRKLPTYKNHKNPNYMDTYAYFHMVSSRAKPEVQKAAWQLAYFLSQHPEDYLAQAGLLQPKKVLIQSKTFKDDPYLGVFLEEMQVNYYLPRIAGFVEVAEAVRRAVDRCVTENANPKESLATAQKEVTDILTKARAAAKGG